MKWIAKARALVHRYHAESFILGLFLLGATGLLVFLKLASEVREGESFAFDRWLLLALRQPSDPAVPIGPAWVRGMMLDFTSLGGTAVLTLITVAVVGYLLVAKRVETAAFVAVAISGGALVSTLLKMVFSRARPELVQHLVEVTSASFPSGHAMNSAVTYLTLGALLARTEKAQAIRVYLMGLAIVLTLRDRVLARLSRSALAERRDRRLVPWQCLGDPVLACRTGAAAAPVDRTGRLSDAG